MDEENELDQTPDSQEEQVDDQTLTDADSTDSSDSDDSTDADTSTESESDEPKDDVPADKIKKLNSENKSLRSRLRSTEQALSDAENGHKTALDSMTQERDSYKQQYDALLSSIRAERLEAAMVEESRKAGAIEPSAVLALADTSEVAVEFSEAHAPTNVEAVIAHLKSRYPRLFGSAGLNGNAGAQDERAVSLDGLSSRERIKQGLKKS